MALTITRRTDMAPTGLFKLPERTYLDADGKPTTDELKANSLLGIAGDEIPMDRANALGLSSEDSAPPSGHELAERTYLTADGQVTTDESKANTLLGNAGDVIPVERAAELGLADEGDGDTEPTKEEVMAAYARELRKLKADEVRERAAAQDISTEGNADDVRGRLMEAHSAAYDAEHAAGGEGDGTGDQEDPDPDVVDE